MPAINGVRNSAVVKNKKGKVSKLSLVLAIVISILVTVAGFLAFWNFYYQEQFTNSIILQLEAGESKAYRATRDIAAGEYLDGAVEEVVVPGNLVSSDLIPATASMANLKASGSIKANSLITEKNSFNPELQNPVLESTRIYTIDYIDTPGVSQGDFIDIHLKVYRDNNSDGSYEDSYEDSIVCSKIEILSKDESGVLQMRLSEGDILNLNSAVIEATSPDVHGEIYVGKYVSPATQPKAIVNYEGKGIAYTYNELLEAQNQLKENSGMSPVESGVDSDNQDQTTNETMDSNEVSDVTTDNTDSNIASGTEE